MRRSNQYLNASVVAEPALVLSPHTLNSSCRLCVADITCPTISKCIQVIFGGVLASTNMVSIAVSAVHTQLWGSTTMLPDPRQKGTPNVSPPGPKPRNTRQPASNRRDMWLDCQGVLRVWVAQICPPRLLRHWLGLS